MKKLAAILVLATLLALSSLTAFAAAGDDIALAAAGTKIIDKCGDGTGKGSGLAVAEALINGSSKTENVSGNKWWCNGDVTHTHPLVHTEPHFVVFDLGAEKSFDEIKIDLCAPESSSFNAKEWDISVSNDNKTWVKIDEVKDNPADNAIVGIKFGAPIKARYIKWTIYKAEQKDELGEIRMYGFSVLEAAAAGTFPANEAAVPGKVTTTAPPTTARVTTTKAPTSATSATTATSGVTTTSEGATTTAAASSNDEDGGLSMGVIIAIIAGAVVVIGVVVFIVMKGKKK